MRLISHRVSGQTHLSVVVEDLAADIGGILATRILARRGYQGVRAERLAAHLAPPDIADFLALGQPALNQARDVADYVSAADADEHKTLTAVGYLAGLDSLTYAPTMSPSSSLYCAGLNYRDHVAEQAGRQVSSYPSLFLRIADSIVGHRQPLVRPAGVSVAFDFEGELAVVIGRPGYRVPIEQALDYVAGYSVFNDGSVRDYQKRGPEITQGKNFFRTGALGPWLVTADEVGDPQDIHLTTTLSGEVMQSSNTKEMIFDVATLIATISEFSYLQPGDVIATGTPAGVGFRRSPQRFMQPGERVQVAFDRVGVLENKIVDEVALVAMGHDRQGGAG
jgi:2-keto-4-pentenoate hydratase/2-oxohepta-3-ene-1,7-dioic acid hydratase in catechol pathway